MLCLLELNEHAVVVFLFIILCGKCYTCSVLPSLILLCFSLSCFVLLSHTLSRLISWFILLRPILSIISSSVLLWPHVELLVMLFHKLRLTWSQVTWSTLKSSEKSGLVQAGKVHTLCCRQVLKLWEWKEDTGFPKLIAREWYLLVSSVTWSPLHQSSQWGMG